jgi:co-chaperonin GroES (HSP10)
MSTNLNIDFSKFKDLDPAKEKAKREDPRKFFLEDMGDLSGVDVFHNLVLVKIYERSQVTAGGILRPDQNLKEDIWQGVVGMVIAKGPLAFVDDDKNKFCDKNVEVGDWILFRTADTGRLHINGKECRILQDAHVRAKLSNPDIAY